MNNITITDILTKHYDNGGDYNNNNNIGITRNSYPFCVVRVLFLVKRKL